MKKLLLTTILLIAAVIGCVAQKAKNVTVTTAADFIKAIAPNTNITIKNNGILSITDAIDKLNLRDISDMEWDNYPSLAPGAYYVEEPDGKGLVIINVNNLTITGGGSEMTHIQVTPTYAEVIRFFHCNNVTMKNIMAGHVETGTCSGDVLYFNHCKKILLEKCDLYGCGVDGIWMNNCNDVTVNKTEIHDCSEDYVVIRNCNNILFNECIMRDCGGGLNVDEESTVDYQKCDIRYNEYIYGDEDYSDRDFEDDEYYDDSKMPAYLDDPVNAAGTQFEKYLCNSLANGAVYLNLGMENGEVIVAEDCGKLAAFLVQIDDGEITFEFLDNVDTKKGEKMGFAEGHILVMKEEDGLVSYEIQNDKVQSITSFKPISEGKFIFKQGKTKNTLKECSQEAAMPHIDLKITDLEEYRKDHEEYPWG